MFKKYKILALVLALVLVVGLVGCGSKDQPSNSSGDGSSAVTEAANAYFANMPDDIYKIGEKDFIAKVKANESMFILDMEISLVS